MSRKNEIRFYVDVDLSKCESQEMVKQNIAQVSGVISVRTERDVESARATEDYIRSL